MRHADRRHATNQGPVSGQDREVRGHTIAAAINRDLQFDPVKDFAGITLIATVPLVMIVPGSLGVLPKQGLDTILERDEL
jgi:hypothetical protein